MNFKSEKVNPLHPFFQSIRRISYTVKIFVWAQNDERNFHSYAHHTGRRMMRSNEFPRTISPYISRHYALKTTIPQSCFGVHALLAQLQLWGEAILYVFMFIIIVF